MAGPLGRAKRLVTQPGTGPHGLRCAEPGRGLGEPADLEAALLTAGQVPLEPGLVRPADRVQRVRAGQQVQFRAVLAAPAEPGHHSAPRQSRIRISPSRIRVFTVPGGTPSSRATSL